MKLSVLVVALLAVVSLSSFKGEKVNEKAAAVATFSVSGSVVDKLSGESLVGVLVSIEGTELKTYTDFDGNFTFNNLKEGSYNVKANLISYKEVKGEKINVNTAGENKVDVKMEAGN